MRTNWRGILGIAISVLLLLWVLRDVDVADVWRVLKASNVALFILATALATCIYPLRALRWRYILWPVRERLPLGPLWHAST
jgi:glycosyltransferase 2 family protein